jgi:hypothetical protein
MRQEIKLPVVVFVISLILLLLLSIGLFIRNRPSPPARIVSFEFQGTNLLVDKVIVNEKESSFIYDGKSITLTDSDSMRSYSGTAVVYYYEGSSRMMSTVFVSRNSYKRDTQPVPSK